MSIKQLVKRPVPVLAVEWTGANLADVQEFCASARLVDGQLHINAGVDGAQGPVPVPVGHWVFGGPGDYWPVDAELVARNYIESKEQG